MLNCDEIVIGFADTVAAYWLTQCQHICWQRGQDNDKADSNFLRSLTDFKETNQEKLSNLSKSNVLKIMKMSVYSRLKCVHVGVDNTNHLIFELCKWNLCKNENDVRESYLAISYGAQVKSSEQKTTRATVPLATKLL